MPVPSFFDWVAAARHNPFGNRIPWLERHLSHKLTAIPASVLALHVPSAGGSGPGQLVIAPDGDSAFITESGTCWEIGNLQGAIKEIHAADDGRLQVFLMRPTSLHVTVEPEASRVMLDFLGIASERSATTYSEGDMGLFGKKSSNGLEISYPAGQGPPAGMPLSHYLSQRALGMTANSGIPNEDVMAYSEAGYAHVLGVPENDLIIAWGPALIQTPEDKVQREGTVVVTRNTMLAYWQPGRTSMIHTFQANHSAATDAQEIDDLSMQVQWEVAEYANNQGKFLVGDAPVLLSPLLSRDGHANRRALTWYFTLAALIQGEDDGFRGPTPPSKSGGLGSTGKKL